MKIISITLFIIFSMINCGQQTKNYSCIEMRNMSMTYTTPILTQESAIGYAICINKKFYNAVHTYTFDCWNVCVSQEKDIWTVYICSKSMGIGFEMEWKFNQNGDILTEHIIKYGK